MDHDLVLTAATSEDRSAWTKALRTTFKALEAAAPTAGWLTKQGGRTKTGMAKMFSRDKKRWFVLTQPEDGGDATFRYYEGPPAHINSAVPKGAVVLNSSAVVQIDEDSKLPHAFKVQSKGASDTNLVTTVLAAESKTELGKWIKAVHAAITACDQGAPRRRARRSVQELAADADAKVRKLQKQSSRVTTLMQMAKLDREEMMALRLKQLHELAAYVDAVFDPQSKDGLILKPAYAAHRIDRFYVNGSGSGLWPNENNCGGALIMI